MHWGAVLDVHGLAVLKIDLVVDDLARASKAMEFAIENLRWWVKDPSIGGLPIRVVGVCGTRRDREDRCKDRSNHRNVLQH